MANDRVIIEDEIRYITTSLEGQTIGLHRGRAMDADTRRKIAALGHLSHLLCLTNESPAVAVIGNVKASGISLLVIAPNGEAEISTPSIVDIQEESDPDLATTMFLEYVTAKPAMSPNRS